MKTNPRRRPATHADVARAADRALRYGINATKAMFFAVLKDKHDAPEEDLETLWREIEELSEAIEKGYVSVSDLEYMRKCEKETEVQT